MRAFFGKYSLDEDVSWAEHFANLCLLLQHWTLRERICIARCNLSRGWDKAYRHLALHDDLPVLRKASRRQLRPSLLESALVSLQLSCPSLPAGTITCTALCDPLLPDIHACVLDNGA